MADIRPELADLSRELDDLTWPETMKFGVQRGMKFSVLRNIGDTQPASVRLLAAMDAWLESDSEASWKKVVRDLRAIKKEVLALELEEKYCRDGGCGSGDVGSATVAEEATATHNLSGNLPAPLGV